MMQHYFVWGMGLLGTSIALDLKKQGHFVSGCVLTKEEKSFLVRKLNFVEKNIYLVNEFNISKVLLDMDAMVIATPVDQVISILKKIAPLKYKNKFWITDVSSSKKELIQQLEKENIHVPFIPSHPMAGSDKTGCFNGKVDLFKEKTIYIIESNYIKNKYTNKKYSFYKEEISFFWKQIGALPYTISSEIHDTWAAYLSHGPHLLSCFTCLILEEIPEILKMKQNPAGGSFLDITRVSGSNPNLWHSIISTNKKETLNYLKQFSNIILEFIEEYENEKITIQELFEKAHQIRKKVLQLKEL